MLSMIVTEWSKQNKVSATSGNKCVKVVETDATLSNADIIHYADSIGINLETPSKRTQGELIMTAKEARELAMKLIVAAEQWDVAHAPEEEVYCACQDCLPEDCETCEHNV